MQKYLFSVIFLLFSSFGFSQNTELAEGNISTDRTKTNINLDWKFFYGEPKGEPQKTSFNDNNWEDVSLPHTTKILSFALDSVKETWVQEKFLRNKSWYRKKLFVPADAKSKNVYLEFEAVHNATELWVNGKKVGAFEINGYVPFHFEISKYVKFGKENIIAIKADNTFRQDIAPDPHKTDYIKFGGIYRDVYLVTKNKLHVTYNWDDYLAGVHITTPTVNDKNGTVSIKTSVKNDNSTAKNCKIETLIINHKGEVIRKLIQNKNIAANGTNTFYQTATIEEDFYHWSPQNPYLYRVYSIIYDDNKPVDVVENTFGFRNFKLVKGKGLILNGKPIFLIGANRHQSFPHIGDAVPNSLHYQEALQFKKAGFNAVRLSHYTQDDAFIKACDELGIVVYEEVSTWIDWGDETWFDKLNTATRHMIRNHRNHPSIFFWGGGINHRGPVPTMQETVKEEDPFRLTASASAPWNGPKNSGITDIHATMDYRRTEWPENNFTMVMEHGSSPNGDVNQFHISRYKSNENNIAALTWLGADYNHLQPTVVDWQWVNDLMTTYGVFTPYRLPKPVFYWYQSEMIKKPIVHIADATASKDGRIRVFSNCQEIHLYHNDKLVAIQKPDNDDEKKFLNHPSFTFDFNFTSGTLKAVGYSNGEKVTEHFRHKEGSPYKIELFSNLNNSPFYAGGSDLKLVHAKILDKNGEVVTSATNKITYSIKGEGELVFKENAYMNPAMPFDGIASMFVRGLKKSGKITITATAEGLQSDTLEITTIPFETDEIAKNSKPIYDNSIERVDIGKENQLVQFYWKGWSGTSNSNLSYNLEGYNADISISSKSNITWNDTANTQGDYNFVTGDGISTQNKKITLTIKNLKKGTYQLVTFHHNRKDGKNKMINSIKVIKSDANGTYKRLDTPLVGYFDNNSTGERKPYGVKTKIVSNGTDSITITLENPKHDVMWLNGLTFKKLISN